MTSALRRFVPLALVAALAPAAPAGAHTVVVNANPTGLTEVTELACADTIYVHVAWDPRPDGAHDLRAVWRNASTDLSQTSDIQTERNTPSSYLWLRYEPGSGAGFARLLGDGPYDGFAGDWTVELSLDGRPFASKRFKVQC